MINTEGKAVQISSGSGEDRREAAEREKSAQPRIHSTSQIGTVVGEVWGGGVRGHDHRSGGGKTRRVRMFSDRGHELYTKSFKLSFQTQSEDLTDEDPTLHLLLVDWRGRYQFSVGP